MRTITLSPELVQQALAIAAEGEAFIEIPIAVTWPELVLSSGQRRENALAVVRGELPPHADPGVFLLRLPVV